jgi:hypothetical protein
VVPVDLSGLIFVALALVWALVLIPKALHNHDDVARTRSVETTSDDARVLTRRTPATAGATAPAAAPRPVRDLGIARQRQRTAARAAARRRRRVLAVLLAATAVVAGTTLAGLTLVWAPAIPATLVVTFLALARVLVRREHAAWDALVAELGQRDGATEDAEQQSQPDLTVVARNDQGVVVVSDQEDTSSLDVSTLRATHLWDPLPMTLPTYVDKPRATRSVRTIDLQGAGVASSGHDAAASALVAEAATAGQQEPPEQRAVGS